jgi:outer membrane protein assembly factor BamB
MLSVTSFRSNGASSRGYTEPTWIRVVSSPAVYDGDGDGNQEAYFGTDSGRVASVGFEPTDYNDFRPYYKWERNVTGPVRSSPALADLDGDGKMELVVGSDNRRVVCLNAEDGTPCWTYFVPKAVFSSPAVADGDLDGKAEVFFGCYDGAVYALDYNF